MLTINATQIDVVLATCIRALPDEGCGLLLGLPDGTVTEVIPSPNIAKSAKVYEIDGRVLLGATRRADELGQAIIGVFHSHTHSEAFPSPTDIRQAPDPAWHYVLVSLRDEHTVIRSYRIVEGLVTDEELRR